MGVRVKVRGLGGGGSEGGYVPPRPLPVVKKYDSKDLFIILKQKNF